MSKDQLLSRRDFLKLAGAWVGVGVACFWLVRNRGGEGIFWTSGPDQKEPGTITEGDWFRELPSAEIKPELAAHMQVYLPPTLENFNRVIGDGVIGKPFSTSLLGSLVDGVNTFVKRNKGVKFLGKEEGGRQIEQLLQAGQLRVMDIFVQRESDNGKAVVFLRGFVVNNSGVQEVAIVIDQSGFKRGEDLGLVINTDSVDLNQKIACLLERIGNESQWGGVPRNEVLVGYLFPEEWQLEATMVLAGGDPNRPFPTESDPGSIERELRILAQRKSTQELQLTVGAYNPNNQGDFPNTPFQLEIGKGVQMFGIRFGVGKDGQMFANAVFFVPAGYTEGSSLTGPFMAPLNSILIPPDRILSACQCDRPSEGFLGDLAPQTSIETPPPTPTPPPTSTSILRENSINPTETIELSVSKLSKVRRLLYYCVFPVWGIITVLRIIWGNIKREHRYHIW